MDYEFPLNLKFYDYYTFTCLTSYKLEENVISIDISNIYKQFKNDFYRTDIIIDNNKFKDHKSLKSYLSRRLINTNPDIIWTILILLSQTSLAKPYLMLKNEYKNYHLLNSGKTNIYILLNDDSLNYMCIKEFDIGCIDENSEMIYLGKIRLKMNIKLNYNIKDSEIYSSYKFIS